MVHRSLRLGDSLDDYCSRCHGLRTHVIVSLVETKPHRMRCQDCHSEHDYRHGKGGRPKKDNVKSLVRKLLDEMQSGPAALTRAKASSRSKSGQAE